MKGLPERLEAEVKAAMASLGIKTEICEEVRVHTPGSRKYSAWIGGSRLSQLPAYDDSVLWREDYLEYGENYGMEEAEYDEE